MNDTKTRPLRMGKNPLDAMLSQKKERTLSDEQREQPSQQGASKVRATFHLPPELFEAVRDAVVFLSGPPARLTLADMAKHALQTELENLQKRYNQGQPFPKREKPLRGGRPIDS